MDALLASATSGIALADIEQFYGQLRTLAANHEKTQGDATEGPGFAQVGQVPARWRKIAAQYSKRLSDTGR